MEKQDVIRRCANDFLNMTADLPEYEMESDVQEEMKELSRGINEIMFMESARAVAAVSGVNVRNRGDLTRFLAGELVPVNTSAQIAAAVKSELASKSGVHSSAHLSAQLSAQSSAQLSTHSGALTYKNADSPELAKNYREKHLAEYLHSEGFNLVTNNGDTLDVSCAAGHVHVIRKDHVLAYGLKTCHTCKCTNPITNSVRKYLEVLTGAPFIIEGVADTCLVSASARMRVHIIPAGDIYRVSRARKYLTVYVPSYRPVERLAKRLATTSHTLRDGRNLAQLARDYGIAMTSAFGRADTATSAPAFVGDDSMPTVRVTPSIDSIFN